MTKKVEDKEETAAEVVKKEELTLHEKIVSIQSGLKAPKNLFNKFGGYKYHSLENILEALKPHLKEHGLALRQEDEIVQIGNRIYIKTTALLTDGTNEVFNVAFARESETKKGFDDAQITGATSSYARKYCLNGLFLLDDTKDMDTEEYNKVVDKRQTEKQQSGEFDSAWHKAIDDWFGRCETEQEVIKMTEWILKKEGIAQYTEYVKEKGANLLNAIVNQVKGE
jgi:hypothetical protein